MIIYQNEDDESANCDLVVLLTQIKVGCPEVCGKVVGDADAEENVVDEDDLGEVLDGPNDANDA